MGEYFGVVASQVLILFLLIGVGVLLAKFKVVNKEGADVMGEVSLCIATPFTIVQSFLRPFDPAQGKDLLLCLALSAVSFLAVIALSLLLRDRHPDGQRVMRFAAIFSNAGFMGLPLQKAVLGEDGVFFGAAFIMVFNIIMWTYGLTLMSGERKLTWRKLVLNPGILGVTAGLILFFTSAVDWLPAPVTQTVGHLASLNTPLPMLVIGYFLYNSHPIRALKQLRCHLTMGMRLVAAPLVTLGIVWLVARFVAIPPAMGIAIVIAQSAPTAAATTVFASKYGQYIEMSVDVVSIGTIFSMVTIPLVVTLAQMIL